MDKTALLVMDVQRGIVGRFGDNRQYTFAAIMESDGCLDADPEAHRVLTEKIFPRQADIRTVADWSAAPS